MFPGSALIVLEDEFFPCVLSISTDSLEMFNVLRCHICQKAEILVNGLRQCDKPPESRGTDGSISPAVIHSGPSAKLTGL
jgi:hypothetical protein